MSREQRQLSRGALGYAIESENVPMLVANGTEPVDLVDEFIDRFGVIKPPANPTTIAKPLNQEVQGACQGHSLALIFSICFFLQTGRWFNFSRAAGYYLSQRKDEIRGDRGSTLSAGQWVATEHGMCLESEWKYPSRYDPSEPPGLQYPYKLRASKPTKNYDLIRRALKAGLPVQDGIAWNQECEQSIVTRYTGRNAVGGHSTTLWGISELGNPIRINSWGNWDGDGCNENTDAALQAQVELPGNTHVIYAPTGIEYPDLEPIS